MAKKIFAQIALCIVINLMLTPLVFADDLADLANPYASDLTPCVQEYKKTPNGEIDQTNPGPDNGYIISIMEEPLNIDEKGSTPTDDYVVRRCLRNTFQYSKPNTDAKGKKTYTHQTVPILATTCSDHAEQLMKQHATNEKPDEYQVKYSCKEVQVILSKGGTSTIYGYISMIYRWGASMVGIVAVTIIIISGIQISASGGDSEAINAGKKRILQSVVGIIVLFLASLILYTINPTFFTK